MSPTSNDKEYKANELIDQALLEYHYVKQNGDADKYNVSVGRYLDKSYFIEFPYKCAFQSAGCMHRFKTKEEAAKHRWIHGA